MTAPAIPSNPLLLAMGALEGYAAKGLAPIARESKHARVCTNPRCVHGGEPQPAEAFRRLDSGKTYRRCVTCRDGATPDYRARWHRTRDKLEALKKRHREVCKQRDTERHGRVMMARRVELLEAELRKEVARGR